MWRLGNAADDDVETLSHPRIVRHPWRGKCLATVLREWVKAPPAVCKVSC